MPSISSISIDDKIRFWSKIDRNGPNGCHLWTAMVQKGRGAGKTSNGGEPYGYFRLGKKTYLTHRVSYFLHYREDPFPNLVLHECNISLCVNAEHLFLGNNFDNMQHRSDCNRCNLHGSLNGSAKLIEEDIPIIRERLSQGESQVMIAKSYGVTRQAIHSIDNQLTWRHVK